MKSRKLFPAFRYTKHLLFILLVMIPSFYSYVIAGHTTTGPIAWLIIYITSWPLLKRLSAPTRS